MQAGQPDQAVAAHRSPRAAPEGPPPAGSRSIQLFIQRLAEILAVAALYVITGKIGFLLAISPGNITVVWPPSGIALAAILLLGGRVWPGVWLGSFLVNGWFFAGVMP